MARLTLHSLITQDLGYCCEWLFFSRYKQTALIAARLGVSTSAVKHHKAAARCSICAGRPNCMRKALRP